MVTVAVAKVQDARGDSMRPCPWAIKGKRRPVVRQVTRELVPDPLAKDQDMVFVAHRRGVANLEVEPVRKEPKPTGARIGGGRQWPKMRQALRDHPFKRI
ncbi:hypothetical protein PG993_011816 [Apiospora rasikravindrae]|uniref:Uncharacterized protein n=1 Tax=Apiospora rasikravindrae TaxID=990691 RepID=A0ABR1S253_9PEZI